MSFFNKKVTLSASNIFSVTITQKVLAHLFGENGYTISNLSIKPSKDKLGLHIKVGGEILLKYRHSNAPIKHEIDISFYINVTNQKWHLVQKYRIISCKFGYFGEPFKLSFDEGNAISPYNELDAAKVTDLQRNVI